MEVITNWSVLIRLAREASLAQSRFDKNPDMKTCRELVEAKNKHRCYEQSCLGSDKMIVPRVNLY